MTWILSVVSVVHFLNRGAKYLPSKLVEFSLSLFLIVLYAISIFVNNMARRLLLLRNGWIRGHLDFFVGLVLAEILVAFDTNVAIGVKERVRDGLGCVIISYSKSLAHSEQGHNYQLRLLHLIIYFIILYQIIR